MSKLKVMVVDDSVVYRRILTTAVSSTGLAEADCTASDGSIALEKLKQREVDIVLLDVNMPQMDGIKALAHIRADHPSVGVIMISSSNPDSAKDTVRALETGALDFILKPAEGDADKNIEALKRQLHAIFAQVLVKRHTLINYDKVKLNNKVKRTDKAKGNDNVINPVVEHKSVIRPVRPITIDVAVKPSRVDLVIIASSTGGPAALDIIFKELSAEIKVPIVVVQHMPPTFTSMLAQSLNRISSIKTQEAEEGMLLQRGEAVIAPGGSHTNLIRTPQGKWQVELNLGPLVHGVRPAADVLLRSIAQSNTNERILMVVLTGMGSDGMEGVRAVKGTAKAYCITQDEASCVVYGMPKMVYDAGLSDEELDISKIAGRINELTGS